MCNAIGTVEGGFCFDGLMEAPPAKKGRLFVAMGPRNKKGGLMDMVQEGTVKCFSEEKGYSFISSDDGGEDIFVHHMSIEGTGFKFLEEGAKVTYEASQGRKGMQAAHVSRA